MSEKTKSKVHAALSKFKEEVKKGFLEKVVEIAGTKFTLQTPTEDEEVWSDTYTRPTSAISYMSSRRAPRLSVAIKKVNDIPISDIFTPSDSTSDEEKEKLKEPETKRYWLYLQMMAFLAEEIPPPVVEKLYEAYEELLKERTSALDTVIGLSPNSKTKTPGSTSVAM
jgi:hypothetical protein